MQNLALDFQIGNNISKINCVTCPLTNFICEDDSIFLQYCCNGECEYGDCEFLLNEDN